MPTSPFFTTPSTALGMSSFSASIAFRSDLYIHRVPYLIFPLGLSQAILDRSINPVGFTQSLTYVRALVSISRIASGSASRRLTHRFR